MRHRFILSCLVLLSILILRDFSFGQFQLSEGKIDDSFVQNEMRLAFLSETEVPQSESTSLIRIFCMVRQSDKKANVFPIVSGNGVQNVNIFPEKADLNPNQWTLFYIEYLLNETLGRDVRIQMSYQNESEATIFHSQPFVELINANWEKCARNDQVFPKGDQLPSNLFTENDSWTQCSLPLVWDPVGITWLRLRFEIPDRLKNRPLTLMISAIDDNDKTWLNGQLIGETQGWNQPRYYSIPSHLIQDGKNELLVGVNNIFAGGGIASAPFRLVVRQDDQDSFVETFESLTQPLFPEEILQHESKRQPPSEIASPLPIRPLTVRNGVLEYEDGGEVAL